MHSMTGWTLIVLWGMVSGFGRGSEAEITSSQIARGRVFHDVNGNGSYDQGEKLLSGIRVSNGLFIRMPEGFSRLRSATTRLFL